ncbi:MAG: hypothetical protein GY940_06690 [bacterium]|nr:hypothetical protein [bacterium]
MKREDEALRKIQSGDTKFDNIRDEEYKWLKTRRQKAGVKREEEVENTVGLGLSGGGIRSATFNLGLLQALERYGVLKNVDYLSTVSGGGYIGSCLTWFMSKLGKLLSPGDGKDESGDNKETAQTNEKKPDKKVLEWLKSNGKDFKGFPFGTHRKDHERLGGVVLAWLRSHGKFLTPGEGLNIWALLSALFSGILVSLLVMVPVFLLVFFLLSRPLHLDLNLPGFLDPLIPFITAGGDGTGATVTPLGLLLLLGMVLLALFLVTVFLFALSTAWTFWRKPKVQKWMRKWGGDLLKYGALLVIVGTIPMVFDFLKENLKEWKEAAMAGVSFSGIIAMFSGSSKREEGNETKGGRSFLLSIGLTLLLYGFFLWFYEVSSTYVSLPVVVFASLISLYLAIRANINHVSMHRFYRNRLMQAYMPEKLRVNIPDDKGEDQSFGLDLGNPDKCFFKDIKDTAAPYHIVNTNIQTIGSNDYRLSGRGGDNFIFSPCFVGSDSTQFIKTEDYAGGYANLATAFAVSGAAVDPNTFATRSRPLSFVMTLLNFRLGYWIRNPRNRSGISVFRLFKWYYYMFAEMFGSGLNETQREVHLSDGGHFENLGLYELIRRHCKYIIISDAGADAGWKFGDLAKVIQMVRLDFGARIEITDIHGLKPDEETGISPVPFAYGTVTYVNGDKSHLIYIKTTMIKDLPEDLNFYRRKYPDFPDQSTMDQFFDEPQFEAYRELGFRIGRDIFKGFEKENLVDFFRP